MAYFSDRLISANKLIIAAAIAYAGAVGFAHANVTTAKFNRYEAFLACFRQLETDPATNPDVAENAEQLEVILNAHRAGLARCRAQYGS